MSSDGTPERTLADLRSMHTAQQREIEARASMDEIVISDYVNGPVSWTQEDIALLHERQRSGANRDVNFTDEFPAPYDEGTMPLSMDQLRELHESQHLK